MIVIGDVHGNYETLIQLIKQFPKDETFCFVGDLIDRGPDSMAVVEFVINGGYDCCLGNHEEFMINSNGKALSKGWILPANGGMATMMSYGLLNENSSVHGKDLFSRHSNWMKQLPLFLEYKNIQNDEGRHLLVTHSSAGASWKYIENQRSKNLFQKTLTGLKSLFGKNDDSKNEFEKFKNTIIWEKYQSHENIPNIYNIFGHTVQYGEIIIRNDHACIDSGVYQSSKKAAGFLTALQFPEMNVYRQKNVDKRS